MLGFECSSLFNEMKSNLIGWGILSFIYMVLHIKMTARVVSPPKLILGNIVHQPKSLSN